MKTLAVILAGGASARMGRDKAGLEVDGRTMLERTAAELGEAFGAVAVSVDRPGRFPGLKLPEIVDLRAGAGPLAGLEAAFVGTGAESVFLAAVDLPFLDSALARRLAALRGEADACAIRRGGRWEGAFAAYGRSCLPHVGACLDSGGRSFQALFERLHVRAVEEEELPEWDLERVLLNMNRPEDYRRARALRENGEDERDG